MTNKKSKIILLVTIFYLLITVISAQAANGLVPCGPESHGGKGCQFCDLLILVEKVIDFALYNIAIPLVVVFIVWGGLTIMTAGDSTEKVGQGRKMIQSAIIGVFIALGAWMIINMVLSAIGGGSFVPWRFGDYKICV
jgi:hypothetical protein